MHYEVIVGNIGSVYSGMSKKQAQDAFTQYKRISIGERGRGAGEPVTLLVDGEIKKEHEGRNDAE